jgi:hypothetical protein
MGALWKLLASRWLYGAGTTPELPSRMRADKRKQDPVGEKLQSGRPRSRAPSGMTNDPEDQLPEETLQPGGTVRYPC